MFRRIQRVRDVWADILQFDHDWTVVIWLVLATIIVPFIKE